MIKHVILCTVVYLKKGEKWVIRGIFISERVNQRQDENYVIQSSWSMLKHVILPVILY
jgi:hypothetical protein